MKIEIKTFKNVGANVIAVLRDVKSQSKIVWLLKVVGSVTERMLSGRVFHVDRRECENAWCVAVAESSPLLNTATCLNNSLSVFYIVSCNWCALVEVFLILLYDKRTLPAAVTADIVLCMWKVESLHPVKCSFSFRRRSHKDPDKSNPDIVYAILM